MTDKVQKIREEVVRLKSQLIRGACSSQIAMETGCKEEAYNEVLAILDTMKEEPVYVKNKLNTLSDGRLHLGWIDDAKVVEFEECLMQFHKDMSNIPQDTDSLIWLKDTDGVLHGYSKKLMSMAKEEPVSEDLEEAGKQYLERSNPDRVHQITNAFKAGAQWQKEQMMAKAIDATARPDDNEIWCNLASSNLKDGDKVKIIVIKKD